MSAANETLKNLKADADQCIYAILTQITTAMKTLYNVHDYQANIGATLRDPATALLSTEGLVPTVRSMLVQTRNLKTRAMLIHENTLKLDHTLCQLETLEKEGQK